MVAVHGPRDRPNEGEALDPTYGWIQRLSAVSTSQAKQMAPASKSRGRWERAYSPARTRGVCSANALCHWDSDANSSSPAIARSSPRRLRARLTLLFMVPTAQPQISAASS